MKPPASFEWFKEYFYWAPPPDGPLFDILIPDMTAVDKEALYQLLQQPPCQMQLEFHDEKKTPIKNWADAEAFYNEWGLTLRINYQGLEPWISTLSLPHVEISVDIHNENEFNRVFEFIAYLGNALGRDIYFHEEDATRIPTEATFRYDARQKQFEVRE